VKTIDVSHLIERLEVRQDEIDTTYAPLNHTFLFPSRYLLIGFKEGVEAEVDELLYPLYDSGEAFRLVTPAGTSPVHLVEYYPLQGARGELNDGRVRFELRK
jgi:hypothetical protein